MTRKPHIIFIVADQLKASATALLGNAFTKTSAWERVAESGVTFANAYSSAPICNPSRTSFLTGTNPLTHWVLCNQNDQGDGILQLPELLGAAGYYCFAAGHYDPGHGNRGWHREMPSKATAKLETAYHHMIVRGRTDVGWSCGSNGIAPDAAHAAVLNGEIMEALEGEEIENRPLFLHVNYEEPHPPYFVASPYDTMFDPPSIPLPDRGDTEFKPAWQRQAFLEYGTDWATDDDVRKLIATYYGMVEYVDRQILALLDFLQGRGILDNAWVIMTADHGDYTGEKGLFTKTDHLYECLLHVPLVIKGPSDEWKRGARVDHLVELTDLFSTILSCAGCSVPPQAQGHDLKAWVGSGAHESAPLRTEVFAAAGGYLGPLGSTLPGGFPACGRHKGVVRGVRDLEYSYVRDPDNGDEAYDLTSDPHELRNLFLDTQASIPQGVRRLQKRLDDYENECTELRKDLGVVPGARNFDQVPENYPLLNFDESDFARYGDLDLPSI